MAKVNATSPVPAGAASRRSAAAIARSRSPTYASCRSSSRRCGLGLGLGAGSSCEPSRPGALPSRARPLLAGPVARILTPDRPGDQRLHDDEDEFDRVLAEVCRPSTPSSAVSTWPRPSSHCVTGRISLQARGRGDLELDRE